MKIIKIIISIVGISLTVVGLAKDKTEIQGAGILLNIIAILMSFLGV